MRKIRHEIPSFENQSTFIHNEDKDNIPNNHHVDETNHDKDHQRISRNSWRSDIVILGFLIPTWILQLYHFLFYLAHDDPPTLVDHPIPHVSRLKFQQFQITAILSILLLMYAVDLAGLHRSILVYAIWILGVGVSSLVFLYSYSYQHSIHHTTTTTTTTTSLSGIIFISFIHTFIDTSIWICLVSWTCFHIRRTRIDDDNDYEASNNKLDDVLVPGKQEQQKNSTGLSMLLNSSTLIEEIICYVLLPWSCACIWTRSFLHYLLWIHLDPSHWTSFYINLHVRLSILNPREIWLISILFSVCFYMIRFFMILFSLSSSSPPSSSPLVSSLSSSSSSFIRQLNDLLGLTPIVLYGTLYSLTMNSRTDLYEDKWWLDSFENYYSFERNLFSYPGIITTITSSLWDTVLLLYVPFLLRTLIPREYRWICQYSMGAMKNISKPRNWVISVIGIFLALEFRVLLPCTFYITHLIHGKVLVQSIWLTIIYHTISLLCVGLSVWFYGRMKHGELLGGEYHDDILQVLLITSATNFALALALPWRAFPFVLVATLSLSLFISTRMARFMILFILTTSSFAYALTFYRFYHIQRKITLIPGIISVTLHQFSLMIIFLGGAWGLFVAMIEREINSCGENLFRYFDAKGVLFSTITCILVLLEVPLSTLNIGYLSRGIFHQETRAIYHPMLIVTTSIMLIFLAYHAFQRRIIYSLNYLFATSLCIAKAITAATILVNKSSLSLGEDLQAHHLKKISALFVTFMVIRIPIALINASCLQRKRGKWKRV